MDPFGQKATGLGVEGHGSEYLAQNQINVNAELDGPYLNHLHSSNSGTAGIFPKALGPLYLQVAKNDFVVTYRIAHPREAQGSVSRPLIHSVFNGEGSMEAAAYPGKVDLQMAAMLSKWVFMGVAHDGKTHIAQQDVGTQQIFAVTVAGATTHKAHQDMYTGAIVFLRLPQPGERPMRGQRDAPGAIKLIPSIKTPESIWKLVSSSVKRYLFDLTDDVETRYDRALRKIDPGRNAYETFADTAVVFGLEFLKVLMDKKIIQITHPARGEVEDRFSFRPAAASGEAIAGTPVLLGLAQAFGIVPPEVNVPGVELTLERRQAFHRMRKMLTAVAWYDGTTREHAFHAGIDPVDWTKVKGQQTAAQRITQAQLDTPRNLVAALDDLLQESNRWCIGTCIQGAPKEKAWRLHLK